MDSHWKEFDRIKEAHEFLVKAEEKVEKAKSQRIVGKKPSQYIVECSVCGKPSLVAFVGISIKKKGFVCFDCLSKDQ
jgi:uncharacterized ferredoxin-like protein